MKPKAFRNWLGNWWTSVLRGLTPVGRAIAHYPRLYATPYTTEFSPIYTQDFTAQYCNWVCNAVTAIEQSVSGVNPRVSRITGDDEYEREPLPFAHPLRALLRRPTPLPTWTANQHRQALCIYQQLQGNAFCYKWPQHQPRELWPIPAQYALIEKGNHGLPDRLAVTLPGTLETRRYDMSRVLWVKRPNPLDPLGPGLSPIGQHQQAIELQGAISRAKLATFRRGQRPGLVFVTDEILDDEVVRRMEARVAEKYEGDDKWFRPLIAEAGLKPYPITLKPGELDFLESSRMSRDEILAMYRVPLVMMGVGDTVTGLGQQTWNGAIQMFTRQVCDPYLLDTAAQETRQLAWDWSEDLAIHYPTTQPKDRNQERADEAVDRRERIRPINEIRTARGLRPLTIEDMNSDNPADNPFWGPTGNVAGATASRDPAPDAAPTNQSATPPGPRPSNPNTAARPTTGDDATA